MSTAIATIEHVRGESIAFGLRATEPAFDGTETVTCEIKVARNGNQVPSQSQPVVTTATSTFVAENGAVAAHWLFSLTPAQSAVLQVATYITDAKIVLASGAVDYPLPIAIKIDEAVTA